MLATLAMEGVEVVEVEEVEVVEEVVVLEHKVPAAAAEIVPMRPRSAQSGAIVNAPPIRSSILLNHPPFLFRF